VTLPGTGAGELSPCRQPAGVSAPRIRPSCGHDSTHRSEPRGPVAGATATLLDWLAAAGASAIVAAPGAGDPVPATVRVWPVGMTREQAVRNTSGLDGARLAHIAAHGVFRSDNPMFSHLRLVDGPLTVYELERLARPPRTVILSACDSALSAVHPVRS
jgi:CHAT domain